MTHRIFFLFSLSFLVSITIKAETIPAPKIPDFPPEDVSSVMDMQQMQLQLNALPLLLPPHREDPYRPKNVVPTDSSYKYWTDVEGYSPYSPAKYHVKRSQWGEWTNFKEVDQTLDGYDAIDLLTCEDGSPVKNVKIWEKKRRKELLQHCMQDVWGFVPEAASSLDIAWETSEKYDSIVFENNPSQTTSSGDLSNRLSVKYLKKNYLGVIDSSMYPEIKHAPVIKAVLYQPVAFSENTSTEKSYKKATPVMIQLGRGIDSQPNEICLRECFSRGWGYLIFECTALQPDKGMYLTDYLIGMLNKGNWRQPTDWGAMAAWSWGVGRIMDELSKDKSIAIDKIGVTGHSRYGKTALLAMVYEPRLSIAYVSCSGVLGAAPMRTNWGENLEVIASEGSYHWAAGNIFQWVGPLNEGEYMPRKRALLPMDAHALLSLVAPRPVFINAGNTDHWANPIGMYCTCRDASPVYALYGLNGLIMPDRTPIADKDYIDGNIGFRLHNGGHNDLQDWPAFGRFAERFW